MHNLPRKMVLLIGVSATALFTAYAADVPTTPPVAPVVDAAVPAAPTLVDETIAEVNELLELVEDSGRESDVEFAPKQEKIDFKRGAAKRTTKDVRTAQRAWSKDSPNYQGFEAVQIEIKNPVERAPSDALLFEEPMVERPVPVPGSNPDAPLFTEEEEFGQPGLVYSHDQKKKLTAKEKAAAEEAAAKAKELAELDGEVEVEEEKDTLAENAKEIQRRFVVGDESPPMVQTGDKWYQPLDHMTHVQLGRRERIRETLDFYYSRMLNTRDDSPWSMMHHMIAWGTDARIWINAPGGRHESCIGWLCANGACEGERLLYENNGQLKARTGPGLQGHTGQFLAMLAQTRVRADQPIQVGGQMFTVKDLIKQEQLGCRPNTELTFKLIGLVHYLDTDASWVSSTGEHWNIERLIREEMRQPINGTTCGGTHRLMGMTYAIRRRQQEGKPLDGEFQRAEVFTARYRQMAYDMQNGNGTFSSDFWRSRGTWGDFDRKLKTTGHILEWMIFSCPQEELQDPRLVSAVDWLAQMMMDNRYFDFEKGPLGHGVRALSLYDERVFGGAPSERGYEVSAPPMLTKRAINAEGRPTATTSPKPAQTQQPRKRGIFGGFRRR